MARLVLKFGGTSLAGTEEIREASQKVAREVAAGHEVAVVVSAMAGVTNQLADYCQALNPGYDDAEYDAVVSSGENITAGLMAIALQNLGVTARSWQGWQLPVLSCSHHRKARIANINIEEMRDSMAQKEVAVLAGFQGISEKNRITTLGRGGSDTTAVALAAALKADRCDIYTDVEGVFTTDPRIVPAARKLGIISYEEMIELASVGAKVLQTRSVEMAMKYGVHVQVLSAFGYKTGSDLPGTSLVGEDKIMEQELVNGITYTADEVKVTLVQVSDQPGIAADIFGPLAEAGINIDMIVQNISHDGKSTDLTFTVMRDELTKTKETLAQCKGLTETEIRIDENVAKVSVIGIGMRSHAGVAKTMFKTLAEKGINIQVISTSEIKISVLISAEYAELAVRSLHSAYELEKEKA